MAPSLCLSVRLLVCRQQVLVVARLITSAIHAAVTCLTTTFSVHMSICDVLYFSVTYQSSRQQD